MPELAAPGLFLRPLDPARDGPALHAIFGDEESCRYLSRPAVPTLEETVALMERWTSGASEKTSWVVTEETDGPALGRISLFPRVHTEGVWEAACMITPDGRGRNLASRALAPAIDYLFAEYGAHRICADVDPDNIACGRVFQRLGFQLEGRLRGEWRTHIGIRDSHIYGLLADDPRPWRSGSGLRPT